MLSAHLHNTNSNSLHTSPCTLWFPLTLTHSLTHTHLPFPSLHFLSPIRTYTHAQQKGITIEVTHTDNPKPKIHEQVDDPAKIEFGKYFSDHMLLINWTKEGGWESPKITPFRDLSLSPGLSALHYATEVHVGGA